MPDTDNSDIYDIMPHKEIADLKKQLKDLKDTKPASPELSKSMNALAQSMDSMLHLFTEAAEELKLEDKEESDLAKHIAPMERKLDEIIDQNKIIAEAMIAVSDMVKELMQKDQPDQRPMQGQMQQPVFSQSSFPSQPSFAPQQGFSQQPSFSNQQSFNPAMNQPMFDMPHPEAQMPGIPFPNIEEPQKKGIFGRLKK